MPQGPHLRAHGVGLLCAASSAAGPETSGQDAEGLLDARWVLNPLIHNGDATEGLSAVAGASSRACPYPR